MKTPRNTGRSFNPITEILVPFALIGGLGLITMITTALNRDTKLPGEEPEEEKIETTDTEDGGSEA